MDTDTKYPARLGSVEEDGSIGIEVEELKGCGMSSRTHLKFYEFHSINLGALGGAPWLSFTVASKAAEEPVRDLYRIDWKGPRARAAYRVLDELANHHPTNDRVVELMAISARELRALVALALRDIDWSTSLPTLVANTRKLAFEAGRRHQAERIHAALSGK